jgi:hypothetical protein
VCVMRGVCVSAWLSSLPFRRPQGSLEGYIPSNNVTTPGPKVMERGEIGWAGGSAGPDFFIYIGAQARRWRVGGGGGEQAALQPAREDLGRMWRHRETIEPPSFPPPFPTLHALPSMPLCPCRSLPSTGAPSTRSGASSRTPRACPSWRRSSRCPQRPSSRTTRCSCWCSGCRSRSPARGLLPPRPPPGPRGFLAEGQCPSSSSRPVLDFANSHPLPSYTHVSMQCLWAATSLLGSTSAPIF